ncbi:hypothetical protein CH256_15040 [Rhodococcus sp. 05-2254-6]|uniref:sce7726 family protein n=1 Tax=Rhodococcus sp. 05-2254-6 TaxID=2022489 RepID=UPI000B9B7BA1|nr:sce7726 family protein [Rhodococcus sp. 05-2254-6]OZE30228.1 hypothetical protein CH256_15040 [Rhodococcus sp. 05-2254-6]
MKGDAPLAVDRALHALAKDGLIKVNSTRSVAIDAVHDYLKSTYQLEHVYKSAIAHKRFLARHNPSTASILTEFSVGSSCIDSVIVNGHATGYEIKTEFDTPTKLIKQINDYYKAFRHVYVVVKDTDSQRYCDVLADTKTGLLSLTKRGHLSERKPAIECVEHLNIETMLKSLRKPEYTALVGEWLGYCPTTTPVNHFRTCLEISNEIEAVDFQRRFEDQLRKRILRHPGSFEQMPCDALKHVYLQLNPTKIEYERIDSWLMGRIK